VNSKRRSLISIWHEPSQNYQEMIDELCYNNVRPNCSLRLLAIRESFLNLIFSNRIGEGLLDKRGSVKRLATLAVLSIICKSNLELLIHGNEGNGGEVQAKIKELKANIKSADFWSLSTRYSTIN
jgi:hypothetical protein